MSLTETRKRLEAITPGPWRKGSPQIQCLLKHEHAKGQCKYEHIGWYDGNSIHQDRAYVYGSNPDDCEDVDAGLIVGMWDYEEGGIRKAEDADFIAHAPSDVRWLIEQIERMREMLRPMEFGSMGACRFCTGYHTHDADCEWVKAMGEKS